MNPEIKAQWLEALRSGKYKQGRGMLRTPENSFCCLGVLCDVVDPNKWKEIYLGEWVYGDRNEVAFLPNEIKRLAGIDDTVTLINMNDGKASFKKIADYIENNL